MAKEFITGLRIGKKQIEYATLQVEDGSQSLLSAKKQTLPDDESIWETPESLGSCINDSLDIPQGVVTVGMLSENILLRTIKLPTIDSAELNSMLQLQVDKLSPFAEDRRAWSYEILKQTETSSWALIVTMQRNMLELVGNACTKAGLDLERIDIDAMGWWRCLNQKQTVLQAGRQLILIVEEESALLFGIEDGLPVAFKTVGASQTPSESGCETEIIREVTSVIFSMNLEYGEREISRLDCWSAHKNSDSLKQGLQIQSELEANCHSLSDLPGVCEGLASRMVSPPFRARKGGEKEGVDNSVIDLLPMEWRIQSASLRFKQKFLIVMIAIAAVWVTAMGLLFGFHNLQKNKIDTLEKNLSQLEGPAQEVRELQRKVISYEQYLDRTHSALECLREITLKLPQEIDINSYQFNKGNHILLRGETLSANPVYNFKEALDESDLFEGIELGSIQPIKRKKQTVQTFQMNIILPGGQKE